MEAEQPLGAELGRGMAHLHRHALRRAAAPVVQAGRGQGGGGDAALRRRAHREGGGQGRLGARQLQPVQGFRR
jgi:hypothetical protein